MRGSIAPISPIALSRASVAGVTQPRWDDPPCKRRNRALEKRRATRYRYRTGQGVPPMHGPQVRPRRRLWPVFVPLTLLVALAAVWIGLWFYAAAAAETALAGWRAREAKAGRIYECGSERIGGFPFRIEVRCASPSVELRGNPSLIIKGVRPRRRHTNLSAESRDSGIHRSRVDRRPGPSADL